MISKNWMCASAAAICAAVMLLPADIALAAPAAPAASGGIELVIVTAQKQEENVQTVPLTVTPVSGDKIDRQHIQDLEDLNGVVPNLQITRNSGVASAAGVVIRGIGEVNNPTPYAGKEVSVVVDGVEQGTNQLGLTDQFDVERIEVLAGPQGTLFGANTTGGVINIITRQPTGQYDAYGIVTLGSYNERDFQGAVNLPIIDDELAAKVSFNHMGRDGFYTNLYNGQDIDKLDDNTVRGYLKWSPNSDFNATLEVQVQNVNLGSTLLQNIALPGEVFYRPNTPVNFTIYDNIVGLNYIRTQNYTLTANWTSPIGDVISITNYQHYETSGNLDVGGINCNCLDQFSRGRGWQESEEVRDAFHLTPDIKMLVGVFAQNWTDAGDGVATIGFVSPYLVTEGITNERSTNVAGFTQAYWNVTERMRLQAGVRVAWDEERLDEAALNFLQLAGTSPLLETHNLDGAIALGPAPGNEPNSGQASWWNWAAKVGVDYQVTDDAMLYGYYARGFKGGGFNGRVTVSSAIGPYNPEFVDSFELGFKSQWLGGNLQLNGAAFLNKWTDMQVQQSNYTGPTIASVILNAGKSTTEGFELQAQATPVEGLLLSANLGYLSTHYDHFFSSNNPPCPPPPAVQPPGCAINYAGRDLPYAPHWTYMLEGSYAFPLFNGDASAELQYAYTSPKWGNFTQAPSERLPGVGLLNANVSWGPRNAKWSVVLWGRNLTDKTYVATALDVPPLFTEATLGAPLQWGADLKFKF